MRRSTLWLSGLLCLILLVSLACSQGAPSPAPAKSAVTTSVSATPSPATPSPTPKPATSAAQVSFGGKTVTIIIGTAAGGGTDILARVFARFLPKYLPGSPAVIVRNIVGGEGTVGANYFYRAKPDGSTLMNSGGTAQLAQLTRSPVATYDFLKTPALIAVASSGLLYLKTGIIDKPEDILKAKGLVYGYAAGTGAYQTTLAKELLNLKTDKWILGYSSSEARRAFLAGEINFSYETATAYNEILVQHVKSGVAMPLFQTGLLDDKGNLLKDAALPPILTLKELYEKLYGKPPSGMAWDGYKSISAVVANYAKVMFLPPGTPEAIVRVYWNACEAMVKDPDFKKVTDPLVGAGARWLAGEAVDKEYKANFGMSPELVTYLKSTMANYGMVVE